MLRGETDAANAPMPTSFGERPSAAGGQRGGGRADRPSAAAGSRQRPELAAGRMGGPSSESDVSGDVSDSGGSASDGVSFESGDGDLIGEDDESGSGSGGEEISLGGSDAQSDDDF